MRWGPTRWAQQAESGLRLGIFALGHDCGTEARPQVVGEFVKFGAPVDLDSALRRVANDVAVVAPEEVLVQFFLGAIINHTVEVVGKLF